jgi:hypothetical protein
MLRRSGSGVSGAQGSALFSTLSDSPVSAASAARSATDSTRRASAATRREEQDVAAHDVGRGHVERASAAQHLRVRRRQPRERRDGALGLVLLEEADDGVDDEDRQDGRAVEPLAEDERHQRSGREHPDDDALELGGDHPEHGRAAAHGDAVRPVAPPARRGLVVVEPGRDVGAQGCGDAARVARMPGEERRRRLRRHDALWRRAAFGRASAAAPSAPGSATLARRARRRCRGADARAPSGRGST